MTSHASLRLVGLSSTTRMRASLMAIPLPGRRYRQGYGKGAADPLLALQADAAPLVFHQLPGQCQPQPAPSITPRGAGLQLLELPEQPLHVLLFDADSR